MQNLKRLLENAVAHTTFKSSSFGQITPAQLRGIFQQHRWQNGPWFHIFSEVECRIDVFEKFVDGLRFPLNEFVNEKDGLIGYGADRVIGVILPRRVRDIARIFIRAAVLIGTERAIELFSGWMEGEPLRFKMDALLSGVALEEQLSLNEDICIKTLPKSTRDLPASLPHFSIPEIQYLGGVTLSINIEAEPAFYKLQDSVDFNSKQVKFKWAGGQLPQYPYLEFCEAMSLACNHCIRPVIVWKECGDLVVFGSGPPSGATGYLVPGSVAKSQLSQEQLNETWNIFRKRRDSSEQTDRLDTSISRWQNSKRFEGNPADKFIDLRIALEALYLSGENQELKFRLATRGAWDIGELPEKREEYFQVLQDAYDLGSSAVHGKKFDPKKKQQEKKNTLKNAQDICRQGILKRLSTGQEPDWKKLILGAL